MQFLESLTKTLRRSSSSRLTRKEPEQTKLPIQIEASSQTLLLGLLVLELLKENSKAGRAELEQVTEVEELERVLRVFLFKSPKKRREEESLKKK